MDHARPCLTPLVAAIWIGVDSQVLETLLKNDPQAVHVPFAVPVERASDLPTSRDTIVEFPIHLALKLGHQQHVQLLLQHGASTLYPDSQLLPTIYLSLPFALSDRGFVLDIMRYNEAELGDAVEKRFTKLVQNLQQVPDLSATLTLDFSTWIPFLSRFLPSDTVHLKKKGSSVRLDCSLVGFKSMSWKRGDLSFLLQGVPDDPSNTTLHVLDHINQISGNLLGHVMGVTQRKTQEVPLRFRKKCLSDHDLETKDSEQQDDETESNECKEEKVTDNEEESKAENAEVADDAEDNADALLGNPYPVTNFWSRETNFKESVSFWTGRQKTKTSGGYTGNLYTMENLTVAVAKRPPIWPERAEVLEQRMRARRKDSLRAQGIDDNSSEHSEISLYDLEDNPQEDLPELQHRELMKQVYDLISDLATCSIEETEQQCREVISSLIVERRQNLMSGWDADRVSWETHKEKLNRITTIPAGNKQLLYFPIDEGNHVHFHAEVRSQDVHCRLIFIPLKHQANNNRRTDRKRDENSNDEFKFKEHYDKHREDDDILDENGESKVEYKGGYPIDDRGRTNVFEGSFVAPAVGLMVFSFDNSYSYFRSKEIKTSLTIDYDTVNTEAQEESLAPQESDGQGYFELPETCAWKYTSLKTLLGCSSCTELMNLPAAMTRPVVLKRRQTSERSLEQERQHGSSSFTEEYVTRTEPPPECWKSKSIGEVIESALSAGSHTTKDVNKRLAIQLPEAAVIEKSFTASVAMCDNFPLDVQAMLPIAEVMSKTARHFENLQRFFETTLPRGFPISFDIPLFMGIHARVCFTEADTNCCLDDGSFTVPSHYADKSHLLTPNTMDVFWKEIGSKE